jgi:hypothetical protein
MGHRRFRSGYDDVRLWKDGGGCCRSDAAHREPTHTPHQVDECQDHLGHGRLPLIRGTRPHSGISVERHGQPLDGEWANRPLRDKSAFLNAANLHQRGKRGPVYGPEFEHDTGVWGPSGE